MTYQFPNIIILIFTMSFVWKALTVGASGYLVTLWNYRQTNNANAKSSIAFIAKSNTSFFFTVCSLGLGLLALDDGGCNLRIVRNIFSAGVALSGIWSAVESQNVLQQQNDNSIKQIPGGDTPYGDYFY